MVASLSSTLRGGEHGLKCLPGLLKRTILEGCWRHRLINRDNAPPSEVKFDSFIDFVHEPPLEGIGATVQVLRDLCSHDVEVLALLEEALKRGPGNPTGKNQHKRSDIGTFDIIQDSSKAPTGTSSAAALRRLSKDRPDLLKRVKGGELSPHRAMIEAGFRKAPTPLDLARRAWAKMSDRDRRQFLREVNS